LSVNSQQTEKYLFYAKKIKPIKSDKITEKYKNEKIKSSYTLTTFNFKGNEYDFYSGKFIEYKKNGKKSYERTMDLFGSLLNSVTYLCCGMIVKSETIDLDTTAKSLEEFLFGRKSTPIITLEKEFYINDKKELILWKKGIMVNGKKSGIWEIYEDGKIKKKKKYKNRNKYKKIEKSLMLE
jgi:hypothetical protein